MVDIITMLAQMWGSMITSIANAMGPWNHYPLSAVTVLLITMGMASLSSLATRALVDVELMRRRSAEIKEWQSAYTKAVRAKDQKQIDKLKKKQQSITGLQTAMSKDQMKPTLLTLVPFAIFYYIFFGVFGPGIVVYTPIALPFLGSKLSFWWWYLISSFSVSALIQRIFRMPMVSD
ncbi:MAG: EMC3/TMCO1 family protein [Candidatus Methanomethylicaceae archaeon]